MKLCPPGGITVEDDEDAASAEDAGAPPGDAAESGTTQEAERASGGQEGRQAQGNQETNLSRSGAGGEEKEQTSS